MSQGMIRGDGGLGTQPLQCSSSLLISKTTVFQQYPVPTWSFCNTEGLVMNKWYNFISLYFHWLEYTRVFYFYLSLPRTGLCVFSLTHPVIRHVTLLQYIVLSVTCLYLSFLLSRYPPLLDPCVFADKLGYLKSFYLRGTLSR